MSTESSVGNKNLVSIICRTMGRAELQQALQSVAAQSYPDIEIVLVDAAGTNSLNYQSASDSVPVNLVSTGQLLSRSQAANAGLEAAQGKYIQFLDDDDWIEATHLTQLVDFLDRNGGFQAAYSSTQKITSAGDPIDYVFREDYDPILLMRDNYIPIHSMLFESSLLQQGCRFDEAFDIYEDWDFWLQLSQHTAFHHIDSLTAFYREGGDSNTAVKDVRLRYQDDNILGKGRAVIFDKWLPKWNGERINSLIGQLDQSVLLCEQDAKIHSQVRKIEELHHQNAELHHQIDELQHQNAELHHQNAELHHQIDELQHQLAQQNMLITELTQQNSDKDLRLGQLQRRGEDQARHIDQLEATLDTIYKSKSWKLMGPVRRVGRAFTSNATNNTETSGSVKVAMESNIEAGEQSTPPICSIIIPAKDKLNFLQPCISSVLASEDSNALEIIIVDTDSKREETKRYLQSLQEAVNIRVLEWHQPFNFSAINNFAATQCQSEYLCFLNNDIEIKDKKWLSKLLAIAANKEVGAVGCTLLNGDSSIQHAGIALDEKAIAQHIAVGESSDYLSRCGLSLPFAVDAVTADCLIIKKSLFLRLGGFNEEQLAAAFNDVDLCLRLADKGLAVLLHPGVELIHHESVLQQGDALPSNRKRAIKEHAFMQFRWRIRLLGRIYSSGIPQQIKELALKNEKYQASIADIAREAADLLYLQDSSSRSSSKEMRNMYSTATALPEAQDYFRNLQGNYKNLEAHAGRLQHAHELIESSIFWRMTYPLRWLKNTLTRGSEKRSSTANTGASAFDLSNTDVASADHHSEGQQREKKQLDSSAKMALGKFIASPEKLQFPETDAAKISIILVFYQQAHLSLLCLQSILEFADVSYQLILVDNNSTDDTGKLLNKIQNAVILRNKENLGFVKAVNQAAEVATGEFLLLLNNDALIERNALSNALAAISGNESVGAVGAKIKLLDGSTQEAGSIIWNDGSCLGYGREQQPQSYEFMFRRDVDYCSGAFLLFRRSTFTALNGFDEDFAPAYYEESDFCIRLQKQGLRIVYEPTAEITHYEFASSGGLEGATKLQAKHREILCNKHADFLRTKFENDAGNVLPARTSNDYPNILVIDDRVPHPSLGAGYPRCSKLLHELSKMHFNISFYPLSFPEGEWSDVYTTLSRNIEVILNSGRDGLLSFLNQRKDFYQYIVVSRVHNMEFFNHCLSLDPDLLGDARVIYDAEAVSASREILRREFLGEKLAIEEQQKLIDKELEQSRLAEKIVAVSKNEAEIFKRHGYSNTVVLGHTIAGSPGANNFEQREGLLFVGALRDEGSPNVDSLLWFLTNVFPLLEQTIPGITLHVVGDNSAPSLATINKENIVFTGRLDSIAAIYNNCRLFIAPTRFAAGIPHKIHEAAAMGLPSVTTALLARQLAWQDGKELLVADTAADYAEQCRRLYQDADLWQRLRDAGLLAISKDCSEQTFRNNLASLFSDSLN